MQETSRYNAGSKQHKKNEPDIDIHNIVNIDYAISVSASLLVLIGIIMVFSASYYVASGAGDPFFFFKKQAIAAVMGFCAMFIMANFKYQYLKKLSGIVYVAAIMLLVLVQFTEPDGTGAHRWLYLPIGSLSFQPSELAKVGVIFLVSAVIDTHKDMLRRWSGLIILAFVAAVPTLLVAWGDFSTALIVAIVSFGIIFIASPYTVRYIVIGASGAAGLVLYLIYGGGFRSERFEAWLDPYSSPQGVGWQIRQSLYAVGSGGFFGLGLGQSRQKMGFLPEVHNDIIFSVICEELGFFGAAIILTVFGIIIIRGIRAAVNAVDTFGSLAATGIVLLIGSQLIINVGVVTNSIPNTGVTLPFISYGGSSLTITMFLIGILLNISRQRKEQK